MNKNVFPPTLRAQVITRRTYNRPLNDEGTVFETWAGTVDRVIGHQKWLWERALGRLLSDAELAELEELRALMLERKVSTSGRTLWLGGTEVAKLREASQFNPLKRDERFITSEGVKSFNDVEDGDVVKVLTHAGNWKNGRVACAGERDMLRLGLRRGRSVTSVDSSEEHTWIRQDGSRVQARELEIGDKLYVSPNLDFYGWGFDSAATDEQFWWCYGFVFGDGSIAKSGDSVTSRVRLCGSKAAFLDRFTACGFSYSNPPSCDGDPFVWTGSYQKTLPDAGTDPRLIRAFLRGYLDADGNRKDRHGQIQFSGLSVSDDSAAEFVRKWLPVFGLYVLRDEKTAVETNYGTREATQFSFTNGQGKCWSVEHVEAIAPEECWCLTVDDDHSFVLPNGVVTGNCSFTNTETIYDVVDILWLLLQGCGVGFRPVVGQLTGFVAPIPNVTIIRSTRTVEEFKAGKRGREGNKETWNPKNGVWKISVGDSAEAWAKSIGKILAGKHPAQELILDFGEIRPAGIRLKGYGWISSGDAAIAKAYENIIAILNRRAGNLLTRMDILDMVNWLGTVLSSRRSAEIALFAYGEAEWEEFSTAKREFWVENPQRAQSNNSLLFRQKPTVAELEHIFGLMVESGGSEPGFINEVSATKRAPWFKGCNPCVEILLGNKSFCNLFETDLGKFKGDSAGLTRAVELTARACYRQTCVNLKDGILQEAWHLNNAFLRLLGVGLTGVARRPDLTPYDYSQLQRVAVYGAYTMADSLGLPRPKNVTTIKPSGTVSKIMDTTEGVHKPLGRYIFNNVNFGKHDPLVAMCRAAGYRVFDNPSDPEGVLITFPVKWDGVEFDNVNGVEVNLESAVTQLDRYKMLQLNWCQQNVSCTVSYSPDEVPAIIEWLQANWDHYVGVSFLFRADPTKTAKDLGYLYLPQEVVAKDVWEEYAAKLQPMVLDAANSFDEIIDECSLGGACPTR